VQNFDILRITSTKSSVHSLHAMLLPPYLQVTTLLGKQPSLLSRCTTCSAVHVNCTARLCIARHCTTREPWGLILGLVAMLAQAGRVTHCTYRHFVKRTPVSAAQHNTRIILNVQQHPSRRRRVLAPILHACACSGVQSLSKSKRTSDPSV